MKDIFDVLDEYILIIDKKGDVEYINKSLLDKLNYTTNDINNINDVVSQEEINKILNIDKECNLDFTFYKKDSSTLKVTSNISIENYNEQDKVLIIAKDISEKFYKKEDLEEILNQANFLAWLKDINGQYIYANKYFKNYTYKTENDMLGNLDNEIWDVDHEYNHYEDDIRAIKEMKINISEQIYKNNDKRFYFETYKYPVLENGEVKYLAGTSEDITLKKKLEIEINKSYEIISAMYDILNNTKHVELNTILENMMISVAKNMNIDGMTLLLIDKSKEYLIPKVKVGNGKVSHKGIDKVKINKDELYNYIKDPNNEGIKDIKERINCECITYKIPKNVKYSGLYNIILDDEYIGCIGLSYNKGNEPIDDIDKFMKTICIEIGMIIKNYNLYQDLNKELLKRKEAQENIDLFLKAATDLMCIVDKNGVLKKIGPKWSNTLGWDTNELYNMDISKIIHPDDIHLFSRFYNKAHKDRELFRLNIRCLCKDGIYKWLEFSLRYIKENDNYIVTARDITKDIKMEEERKSLEDAVYLESIKNEFFANISHEFKTPINIILGIMQLLDSNIQRGNIYSDHDINLKNYINSIKQNSYRLLRLINNLIDMTRIDTGFYEIQLGNYDFIKIIEDITMAVMDYIEKKDISLIFDTDIEELVVACDPEKIERVMLNLLSNAIKYTPKGGEIIVHIKYKKEKVIVSVKDNGIGISNDKLGFIFEKFGQANYCLTRPCEGSGIGLSLVKSLIELHNGKVYVESTEGVGSEFLFEIPNKIIENNFQKIRDDKHLEFQREKCNIEFSDIYS